MRPAWIAILGAIMTPAALLHCSSRDVPIGTVDDGGPALDASSPDVDPATGVVDAGVSDAATEDEWEVPDGAVVCDAAPCVVALAGVYSDTTGGSFCALLDDETVSCWGTNLQNQLGLEPDPDGGDPPMWGSSPRRIAGLSDVTSVSVGGENTCVRIADGGVVCWGAAALVNAGRVGDPDGGPPPEAPVPPMRLDLVPAASSVAVRAGTACVTTPSGALWCWGNNASSQLARPSTDTVLPPAEVDVGGRTVASVHPGEGRTFAITTDGGLLSWGSGSFACDPTFECTFLLGRDTSEDPDPIPSFVSGLFGVRGLSTASSHACAIAGPRVVCWGGNLGGELGRGTSGAASLLPGPTVLAIVTDAVDEDAGVTGPRDVPLQVVAGYRRSCAVMGSGRVYCWGATGTKNEWGRPRLFDHLSGPAVALALADGSAFSTSCALLRSGAVECWGSNFLGVLGRGNDEIFFDDPSPAPVVFPR